MDFKKPIPEGEAYYMDDDGNVITESDFIAEFIKKALARLVLLLYNLICQLKYVCVAQLDRAIAF